VSEKNRTGRPLKEHPAGTLVTITLQVPAELKLRLQNQAIKSNRTLSQEAQRRLERSFDSQALHEDSVQAVVAKAIAEYQAEFEQMLQPHLVQLRHNEEEAARLKAQMAAHEKEMLEHKLSKSEAKLASCPKKRRSESKDE
jgi:hypothetical protein